MNRLLSLSVALSVSLTLSAQSIYVMEYDNPQGEPLKSLVYYNGVSSEPTEVRTISLRNSSQIAVHQYEAFFMENKVENASGEKISYTALASESPSQEAPTMIFYWDPDETYVKQRTPFLKFDDNWGFEDYIRAKYCYEISYLQLNRTLISQFYFTSDPMYKRLLDAHNMAVQQEAELVRTLGDGSDLYRTICDLFFDTSTGNPSLNEILQGFYADYYRVYGMKASQDPNTYAGETTGTSLLRPNGNRRNPLLDDDGDTDAAPEAALHLVFVANTEISDIGQAVDVDLRRVSSELKGVCSKLGMEYKPYIVSGMDFGHAQLMRQLDAVQPAANDVVVFVYSGHGFRWNDQQDPYPQLALVTDDYTDVRKPGNYVALSDISRAIEAKGARLSIVLADCCNSYFGEPSPLPLGSNTLLSRGNTNLSTERLRALFLGQQGHIICSAASPGEVSWCSQAGGNFTCNFIESFRKEINLISDGGEASWQHIFDNTVQNTRKYTVQNSLSAQNAMKEVQVKAVKR